nr:reverse transcriptase domain-containing protein [Tanacetum cinerariifolium]
LDECLVLADLGASINLTPLSIWRKLSLPELTSTQMILELADRSTNRPADIAKDVFVKEYVQEVLGYSESGNPTLISDPIIALSSPSLTHFKGGDFILEEIEACLTSKSIPLGIDDKDLNLEGHIHLLEELLNNDRSSSPLPPKELNAEEIKTAKSSIDEPPELKLKELPSHLEYAFLEGTDKLPVKEKQEKDKIRSKPNKNGKRGEAQKSRRPITVNSKQKVDNSNFEEHLPPIATMTDNRTMAEMLHAPIERCAEAIVVPLILAKKFELKHSLINMMTSEQFFGLKKDNPH